MNVADIIIIYYVFYIATIVNDFAAHWLLVTAEMVYLDNRL